MLILSNVFRFCDTGINNDNDKDNDDDKDKDGDGEDDDIIIIIIVAAIAIINVNLLTTTLVSWIELHLLWLASTIFEGNDQ